MKYIKIVILAILDFFLSFFRTSSKKKQSTSFKKEPILEKKEKKNNKEPLNTSSISSLPNDKATNILVNEEVSEELKKSFKKYLELITGIKIKDATLEETKEIERIKNTILPLINREIKRGYLIYDSEIEISFINGITNEIKKRNILPIKIVLDMKEIKQEEIAQKDNIIKNEQVINQNSSLKSKDNKTEEKVTAIKDVLVVYQKQEQKNELEQINELQESIDKDYETKNDIPLINPNQDKEQVLETIFIEKDKLQETILEQEQNGNINDFSLEQEAKVEKDEKEFPKDIKEEKIKDEKPLEEKKNNYYYQKLMEEVSFKIDELKELLEKEELTIEDYDYIERNIEELTNELTTYKLLNDLDNQELQAINEQFRNIDGLKENLEDTKKEDYKKEETIQNETMKQEEITRINFLLQEVYNDHNKDLSTFSLSSIDDLNNKTEEEIKKLEKELLKVKLRKAAKVVEPSFLLSLPFIRNKYFLYFTTGIFLHNHLGIINSLYDRKEASFNSVNISPLMKARESLNNSILLTEDNLIKVREIKNKYVNRYPELKDDADFNKSINKMETKLKSNYEKYVNKENRLKRVKKRSNKINKNIKRKVLVKEPKKKDDENKK